MEDSFSNIDDVVEPLLSFGAKFGHSVSMRVTSSDRRTRGDLAAAVDNTDSEPLLRCHTFNFERKDIQVTCGFFILMLLLQ